jgi:nucleoside-diphosphate-sugar epimerase
VEREKRGEELHVVFGTGQVGAVLAESLLRSGRRVRAVRRSAGAVPDGVEARFGDATDPDFCREAAAGATALYHCMNPPYRARTWEEVLPVFLENLVAAARAADARLVVLENLYMIGTGTGGLIDEDSPLNPRSRKGEIRAEMAEALLEAHRRGDVRAVSGRASDFYGPGGTGTHFADRFWKPALAGKPATFLPNPDQPHTYHYIPDVARGLECLGTGPEDALGRAWMLPCAPAETSRDFVRRLGRALGKEIRIRGMSKMMVRMGGILLPVLREVEEMLYQWEVPFVVDDRRFRAQFGTETTPPDEAAAATVAWARRTYGKDR